MWPVRKNKQDTIRSADTLAMEARGQGLLDKIRTAPHKEPWGITFLMLAWTAGPVTFITAYSAYYIGYGAFPPLDRAIYFLAYALIAGLLGIATKLIYNTTHGHQEKQDEKNLLEVIDCLPELLYMVRDLRLENMGEESRRIESAGIILSKLDLGPAWVALAIEDLTGDAQLARQAEHIELFRRAGLYNRMQDIIHTIREPVGDAYDELRQTHPRIAEAMRQRLTGRVPSVRQGSPREEMFLERILSAIEQDNENLMTLHDVEELLTLCFELICGRRIRYLKYEYSGDWNLARSMDSLEKERNNYRLARARVNSRLRALATYLNYIEPREDINAAPGLSPRHLLTVTLDAMDSLSRQVTECRRITNNTGKQLMALQIKATQLDKAIDLYERAFNAQQKLSRESRRFSRALKVWQLRSKQYEETSGDKVRRSLKISEQSIALDDDDKIKVARQLAQLLEDNRIRRTSDRSMDYTRSSSEKRLTQSRARELAAEIAVILGHSIELNNPAIQRAIDSTPATSLGAIEPGMSPMIKASVGKAMANAVDVSLAAMAERLAQNLIRYYRVPLTRGTMDFLVDTYQANRERLEFIAEHEAPASNQQTRLNRSPIEIPDVHKSWQISLYNARRTLELHA
ncbi:hypothetical protein [Kistimonas asteriae]|uniref:hypothetical protein n=1 Tax=Kistimonas asteriae TaxID=517724 RepID=UPI001BA78FA3|nr:hypothetical protein [Kistimonas asteriae]